MDIIVPAIDALLLPIDKFVLKKKLSKASIAGTIISIAGVALLFL